MGVIDRINHEIERLNAEIVKKGIFNEENGVNLNALVCMLRYAAWKEPQKLLEFFRRDETWEKATINPKIVKRFSIHEPVDDDGAQLRIHIFDDAEETSIHNHQRSFITMCIQGSYEYRYYKRFDEGDSEIEYWNRVKKGFEMSETKTGTIRRMSYSAKDMDGTIISPENEKPFIFDTNSKPLYVDHSWYHTVHPENKQEAVITVLIRREKQKDGPTQFVKGPKDKDFEKEEPTRVANEEEVRGMFETVRRALTKGAEVVGQELVINTNVIEEFMLPKSKIARVSPTILNNQSAVKGLKEFMQLNNFSFTPITVKQNNIEKLVKLMNQDGDAFFESSQERLNPNTPILFGIMYTILSENYVVPIANQETGEFCGMLSLHDILNNLTRLSGPMVQSSIDSNQNKSIVDYTKLLDALSNLNRVVEADNYVWKETHVEEANTVLGILNELILDKSMLNLNIPDSALTKQEGTWLEQISGEVFFVGPHSKSKSLLREFHNVSDFSTFIESTGGGDYNIVSIIKDTDVLEERVLGKLDSNSTAEEFIDWIRESRDHWPVYTYSTKHNRLGIISTDELFSRIGIQKISEQLNAINDDKKSRILSGLLIKSHQRRPIFDETDFDNARELFLKD